MIVLDCPQGSPQWLAARMAIPTASQFDRVLTPKKLQYSADAWKYQNELLTEWLVGAPCDFGGRSAFMERGTVMEPKARQYYELVREDVQQVGFIMRDDGMVGCSPDALVGEEGGLEIKIPAMHTHVGYLRRPEALVEEYRSQSLGGIYLTGRKWWDILSWHPSLPSLIVRVTPDDAYLKALDGALKQFIDELLAARKQLAPKREVARAA
jgi:hypothetical protein